MKAYQLMAGWERQLQALERQAILYSISESDMNVIAQARGGELISYKTPNGSRAYGVRLPSGDIFPPHAAAGVVFAELYQNTDSNVFT